MSNKATLTLRQYAKRCNTSHQTVSAAIKAGKIAEGFDEKTMRINPDVADMEWGLDFIQSRLMKKVADGYHGDVEDDDWNSLEKDVSDIPQKTSLKELVRLELLYKTRMAKVRLEEAQGKLVDKNATYQEMFAFGKEIRVNMQAIPDRIIDQLLSLDRSAAYKLLMDSINEALEKLSEQDEDCD